MTEGFNADYVNINYILILKKNSGSTTLTNLGAEWQ